MSEWQPINTAPKDGTKILAYFPEYLATHTDDYPLTEEEQESCAIHVMYFEGFTDADVYDEICFDENGEPIKSLDDKEIKHGIWVFASRTLDEKYCDDWRDAFDDGGVWHEPSHWMPLPKPPHSD